MNPGTLAIVTTALLLGPYTIAAATSTAVDRLAFTGDGSTLSGTSGGGGGAFNWLHNFDPDSLVTLGGEHQKLGPANWTFGSLGGSLTQQMGDGRYTFSAEAHEGAGNWGTGGRAGTRFSGNGLSR